MKKLLTAMLCIPLCFSAVAFSACGDTTPPTYKIYDYFYVDKPDDPFTDKIGEYISTTSWAMNSHDGIRPKSNVRIKSISGKVYYNPEWYGEHVLPTEDWTTDTFVDNFTVQCDVAGCWDFVMTPESNPEWFDIDDFATPDTWISIDFSTTDGTNFGLSHLVIDFEPVENN